MPTGQPTGRRQLGVQVTTDYSGASNAAASGQPQTLINLARAEFHGVEYIDVTGRKIVTVIVKIGNVWYMPPNSDQWASQLRPIASWLSEQLEERIKQEKVDIPKEDVVDIMPTTNPVQQRIIQEAKERGG